MNRRTRTFLTLAVTVLVTVAGGGIATAQDGPIGTSETAERGEVPATLAAAQTTCSFPVTVTDTTGAEVTVDERPERIVALQPSDAQNVWEIGAADRVVGMERSPNTAYLNDTEGITNVKNDDGTVDVEQVTDLNADVVFAANVTPSATIDQLRNTGTTVYHFGEVSSFEEIYDNVNRTGVLVGNCEGAVETVADMRDRLDRIERAVADEDRPGVLYLFHAHTTGENTHIHDVIEAAGAENVAATGDERGYYEISQEIVAANDLDWIVYPSDAQPPSGAPYDDTTALQEGQVLQVDANYVNQPGPRVVDAVETMAQAFHPESFDENGEPIVETKTATATSTDAGMETDAATATATDRATETPTAGDGPAFTPVTALVALVVAAIALGVRRKGV